MTRLFLAGFATILLTIGTRPAVSQTPAPPDVDKAVAGAFVGFCIPAVLTDPSKVSELAREFKPTVLPAFVSLTNLAAPAWEVPSSKGHVVVARKASKPIASVSAGSPIDVQTCEIIVSETPGPPLQSAIKDVAMCKGCPFTHDGAMSFEQAGIRSEKYNWTPVHGLFISAFAVSMPDQSRGATFFVQVHALQQAQ